MLRQAANVAWTPHRQARLLADATWRVHPRATPSGRTPGLLRGWHGWFGHRQRRSPSGADRNGVTTVQGAGDGSLTRLLAPKRPVPFGRLRPMTDAQTDPRPPSLVTARKRLYVCRVFFRQGRRALHYKGGSGAFEGASISGYPANRPGETEADCRHEQRRPPDTALPLSTRVGARHGRGSGTQPKVFEGARECLRRISRSPRC